MWSIIAMIVFASPVLTANTTSMFMDSQVIFTSTFNITKILVPADGSKFIQTESSELPSIFFTISDPHFDGGSCVYVLEDLAAYEILEGGRDTTADYGSDRSVYIGSKYGVYKYNKDTLSAKKFGPFKDKIIQIQKANGTDQIYYLTEENRLFKLEKDGTVRTKIKEVICATQFVLDTSNNIYFVECKHQTMNVIKTDGSRPVTVTEEFLDIKLLRPAFIMDNCVPVFGDGVLHILYLNGTCERKEFTLTERPSAYSVDAALYLAVALNGKIYEYNVMEVMLKSMFGLGAHWPQDVSKIIMSVIGNSKDTLFGFYKGWYQNK